MKLQKLQDKNLKRCPLLNKDFPFNNLFGFIPWIKLKGENSKTSSKYLQLKRVVYLLFAFISIDYLLSRGLVSDANLSHIWLKLFLLFIDKKYYNFLFIFILSFYQFILKI